MGLAFRRGVGQHPVLPKGEIMRRNRTVPRGQVHRLTHVSKALEVGDSADEIRQVVLLAITTCGFPTAVASMQWVDDVLGGPA